MSRRLFERLEKLDANNDGVVDAAEVMAVMDEMARDQALLKLYRYITIGLFVVVIVLIGALTGITYGIVKLNQETKAGGCTLHVTNFNSNYQMMVTRDNLPAITGGAMLDVSSLTVLPASQRTNLTELASSNTTAAGGRRRLQEAAIDSLDRLTYYGTVGISTVQEACNLLRYGLSTFLVSSPMANAFSGGSKVSTVTVWEEYGCSNGDASEGISALVQIDQAMTYLVLCDVGRGSCDAYYHQDSLAADTFVDAKDGANSSAPSRRRSLFLPLLIRALPSIIRAATNIVDRGNMVYSEIAGREYCAEWSAYGTCCDRCKDGYTRSKMCGCEQVFCFPGDATVQVYGRGTVRMEELQYGDRVRSYDRRTGAVSYKPVYLFGHREAGGSWPYVHLATAEGRTLAATPGHFVPVCVDRCTAEQLAEGAAVIHDRRAGAVRVGDVLLVDGDSGSPPALSTVASVDVLLARGAFNPYVRGADLIVDGVVASPHSDWLLDSIAPAWLVRHLPTIYEAFLTPVYGLYCTVGPAALEWLAQDLRWAETGLQPSGYAFIVAGLSAPALVLALLGKRWLLR
ncbi:hypothetical protein GPECTOR_5g278 [Gonium pectorale]|uniref:EF-hand domain-containing protein n=1 Tax=Gonium pectorale TaxID=33097 RepID=A0A150GWU2_GONPE|nr:hypothetical protein GPECTOR_5g278 [Gonium pectorale]|eukprot:KXZ54182.1 hypothetical protein GPECTOR_5g278 [Gonium pectorale]